jgi:hypothetical protein
MIIGYFCAPNEEIYISANQKDLVEISRIFSIGQGIMICDLCMELPPYTEFARALKVMSINKKLVKFGITDSNEILVEGDPSMLLVISENINSFLDYIDTESHIHIDYFDEHPYLSAESISVVIGIASAT